MNAYHRLILVAALFVLGAACWSGLSFAAQEKGKEDKGVTVRGPDSPKWEYKIAELSEDDKASEKEMNKLGDEGWELVGTTSNVSAPRSGQGSSKISTQVRLVFKKPKK